ncbi:cAMP-binding domain of CRP or a regulatory subunit of cAMP-dependent protein kinases [Bosea sp. CRIB-10]|nr:cAMP-binding domain of CRP or a regulatory subunit of cAMP-dependent protein kinases [Bosea sp. CRIB-10]
MNMAMLSPFPAFATLSAQERKLIATASSPKIVAAGQPAFSEGDPTNHCFLSLSGHLKLVRTASSGEIVILGFVDPGEPFGLGVTHEIRRPASAIALRESKLAVWPIAIWRELQNEIPGLTLSVNHILEKRLFDLQERFVEMACLDVPRRVALAVLRLIDRAGRREADGVRIAFPVSRHDVAALTGTTLHSASRILVRWKRQGVIAGGRRTLLVRDVPALIRLATDPEADVSPWGQRR